MTKFNKPIKIAITLLFISLVFGSGYTLARVGDPIELLKHLGKSSKSLIPTKIEEEIPPYSIVILNSPTNSGGFNFSVEVTNISVAPFITFLTFSKCMFLDNKDNEYDGNVYDGKGDLGFRFPKALLPGEKTNIEFHRVGISLSGGGGIYGGGSGSGASTNRCQYSSNGEYICAPVEGIKFKECKIVASNSTSTHSDILFPLVINFPQ